jgi:uncharacterized protein
VPATVTSISIAPVKGMRMQALTEAEVTVDGVSGDRCFFLVDADAAMISATRLGPLLSIMPAFDAGNGRLELHFPDGETVGGEFESGPPEPVTFYGQPLQAQTLGGDYSAAISSHCGVELKLMERAPERPATDRGQYGAVTIIGSGSLERLAKAAAEGGEPGPVDERRFRMTFTIDGLEAHEEDSWPGERVEVGSAMLEARNMVGRCAATTRDPDQGVVDLKTLHHIGSYRRDIESDEPLPFGIYASVSKPGLVRIGDVARPAGKLAS